MCGIEKHLSKLVVYKAKKMISYAQYMTFLSRNYYGKEEEGAQMNDLAVFSSEFLKLQTQVKRIQSANITGKTNWTIFYGVVIVVLAYLNWDNATYGKYLVAAGVCVFIIAYRLGTSFTKSLRTIQDFESLMIPVTSQDLLINGHQVIGYMEECKKLVLYVLAVDLFNAITVCCIVSWVIFHLQY